MKKLLTLVLTSSLLASYCQETVRKVIVSNTAKVVPSGKKWVLETGKELKVQINEGVLNSGNRCNALFLSNPRMVMNVNKGNIYNSEGYGIIFKSPEKVDYTNEFTYTILPIAFVDKNFSVLEFQYKNIEDIGEKKLEFRAGESVFVSSCLSSIEMVEINMNNHELAEETKKLTEKNKVNQEKQKGFSIPIKPIRKPLPGSAPLLKDSLIKFISFESNAVLFSKRNGSGGFDDTHHWTINLSVNKLEIISSDYNEVYTIVSSKYNDKLLMQEFSVSDETGSLSHTLHIAWSEMGGYTLLFGSLDYKDDYQFQKIKLKELKHQD